MDLNKADLEREPRINTEIPSWSIQERFREVAEHFDDKTAVISFSEFQYETNDDSMECWDILYRCFSVDQYVVSRFVGDYWYLVSRDNVRMVMGQRSYNIYQRFDGDTSLIEIYRLLKQEGIEEWFCDVIDIESPCSLPQKKNCHIKYFGLDGLIQFVRYLQTNRFLTVDKEKMEVISTSHSVLPCTVEETAIKSRLDCIHPGQVLLLGDKPGTAGVGILYLTSYLIRHGVKAKCLFVNEEYKFTRFQDNLRLILETMCPAFVTISMKWFPHIERVFEIARTVKQYHCGIQVIVGGDTASFYAREVIQDPFIDYVICGDGEEALLQICRGNQMVINTFYKANNKIQEPCTYVLHADRADYPLLPLDDIMLNSSMAAFVTFYVPTSIGCIHNCVQCGGSERIQREIMHRETCSMTRPAKIVRQDILQTRQHVISYMFSICDTEREDFQYYKSIWKNVDLSNHICALFSTSLIDEKLLELAAGTFRYIRIGIDMCSLSQRHREKINLNTRGKTQITDEDLFHFLDLCERYDNCEVDIYTIAGMPFYEDCDTQVENQILDRLLQYRCFRGIEWGRLHAQPGVELITKASSYGFIADATDYASFRRYSRVNQKKSDTYPAMPFYHYPYIYCENREKTLNILSHYLQMREKCQMHNQQKFHRITREITYGNLNTLSDILANKLLCKGLRKQENVILYFCDRIYLSIAIMAVIKAGGCYVPLDPMFHLDNLETLSANKQIFGVLTDVECSCHKRLDFCELLQMDSPQRPLPEGNNTSMLYRINSSGSTGSPKCIAIRQAGVANYTNWRIINYDICEQDVVLQSLSEAFDGFGSNFYTALLSGACLIMPTAMQNRDIPFLRTICRQFQITHTSMLPFQLDMLIYNDNGVLLSFRSVVMVGEICSEKLLKEIHKRYPKLLLINEYGPAECSIAVTAHIGMCGNTSHMIVSY